MPRLGDAVIADRRLRLWSLLAARSVGKVATIGNVCAVACSAVGVDAVAITVPLAAAPHEIVYASGPVAVDVEELQLTLGEGPGMDAGAGNLTLIADLDVERATGRWPVFAPTAVKAGVRAMFALPLRIGGVRLGVMSLYRATAGELDREQLADALMLADTACALLLDAEFLRPNATSSPPEQAGTHHPEVHQATGMVTAQLQVSAATALVRLRAHAYAHDRRLRDVAADVVARRLRFDPHTGGP